MPILERLQREAPRIHVVQEPILEIQQQEELLVLIRTELIELVEAHGLYLDTTRLLEALTDILQVRIHLAPQDRVVEL